ncbi:DHA2 family efflux MFS transporter permease subunit [Ktedonosporobacter rubrisoli]|uniref:DHA2 family efflux MFS transporter permease subunit n=1 Tax=Ktedonosporobacter rubrisoli TaxID=2509675 RepID=A0A4P6JP28_KTERU|nr:DHA2 family efflux MFS transporter permease subunit [Ktedonosporobacter rubrisoli]QBD77098.1 DHA2 family efflux MFS transporter permease subunit [Ktedonosporobacter rubrisoli]
MQTAPEAAVMQDKPLMRGFGLIAVISALMLTLLLEALDQTIVGTAMPRIIAELHGLDRYTWVVTAYILASMTMIPIVGKLSDQFGRKWFLLGGTALFLLGSGLAGASQSMDQLIIFRALQGLGAGIGMALVATVFAELFPPAERAKWGSLFGIVYGFSNLFGPAIGGWLTEHGPLLSRLITENGRWRWVFYINIPVGLLALVALLFFLPANLSLRSGAVNKAQTKTARIDFLGAFLSAIATISLMLGLSWGSTQISAWGSPQVLALLGAGVVLFVLFLLVERKAAEPILPLDLFSNQVFSAAALLSVLQMMVLLGLSLYLPLFFQGVLGISPTEAGLVMTPLSISMVVGATVAGPIVGILKRYQLIAILGAVLMVVGTFLITLLKPESGLLPSILFMIVVGIGTGTFFSIPMLAAQNALPLNRLGISTAATRYLGQVGATLGIAVVGTVVSSSASGDVMSHLPSSVAEKLSFAGALQHGFVAVLIFAVIALLATFFLKDVPFVVRQGNEEMEVTANDEIDKELIHS